MDGAATSVSARPHACSRTWKRGFAEDYARIFGGSGRMGTTVSTNCAVVAYQSSTQRSPPVHRPGSGVCPDTRRSNRPYATTTSTLSVSLDFLFLTQLKTQSNRRVRDPYARWCGRGGTARCPPIPIIDPNPTFGTRGSASGKLLVGLRRDLCAKDLSVSANQGRAAHPNQPSHRERL